MAYKRSQPSTIGYLAVLIVVLSCTAGCGVFRSIEQWKCDNMGMCHFGTKPTYFVTPPVEAYPYCEGPCEPTCDPCGP